MQQTYRLFLKFSDYSTCFVLTNTIHIVVVFYVKINQSFVLNEGWRWKSVYRCSFEEKALPNGQNNILKWETCFYCIGTVD